MSDLSPKMQERLKNWRERLDKVVPNITVNMQKYRRSAKGDYGDAMTLEEWQQEAERSQRRK